MESIICTGDILETAIEEAEAKAAEQKTEDEQQAVAQ